MRITSRLVLVASMLGACATAANAAVSFSSNPFDTLPPASGQVLVNNFDGVTNPLFSFSGGTIRTGNIVNLAAAPAFDGTHYEAAEFGNSFTLTGPILKSMSVYIGSLDTYNLITFKGAGGFTQSFSGSALFAPANGNRTSANTNRQFFFTFSAADEVDQVVFSSGKPAFEFDNIYAAVSGVPEPATWTMMILGFGMAGFLLRGERRKGVAALA